MSKERTKRRWPVLAITKTKVIHISRENCPGCCVRTECGRDVEYQHIYTNEIEKIENAKDRVVKGKYGWDGPFKLCSKCGSVDDFVAAYKEYLEKHGNYMAWMKRQQEYVREQLEKVYEEFSRMLQEKVVDGSHVTGVKSSGMGLEFELLCEDGTTIPLELNPSGEYCRHAEEEARTRLTEEYEQIEEEPYK